MVDDQDRPLGVVSEKDLLRKSTDQSGSADPLPLPDPEAWGCEKAEGTKAEELMSAPAVCARPEWAKWSKRRG